MFAWASSAVCYNVALCDYVTCIYLFAVNLSYLAVQNVSNDLSNFLVILSYQLCDQVSQQADCL